jgi:CubicO group peptidase (beta-lactamase class C family)
MRCLLVLALCACGSSKPEVTHPAPPVTAAPDPVAKPPEPPPVIEAPKAEVVTADTPKTTVAGNPFIVPAGWSYVVKGQATIVSAPEGDTHVALVDVEAKNADHAVMLGWIAYGKDKPVLDIAQDLPDRDGWSQIHLFNYKTPPSEKRGMQAQARWSNDRWTVVIIDAAQATAEKRGAQFGVLFGQLLPKGFERETFASKKANKLDKARIDAISKYVETGQQLFGVPGIAVGIIQDGKVVFAGGFGVRELGKPAKVDADTKFMIASNTKAMTTLMLAKLVDAKKLTWETPATTALPQFKLGDADTTSKVMVKHLICACTGLPRQDLEIIFESGRYNTPEKVLGSLATMQPTSKFGELYQYSNTMAAAAGFLGGHIAFPKLELGKAYDEAMRTLVFQPLGMTTTTFDFKKAQTGNFAVAHGKTIADKTALIDPNLNNAIIPARPAGGAWSTVHDVLKYVQMELSEGKLPNGKQYISKDVLLARRAPQVATSKDSSYGMGLAIVTRYGVTVVEHGGDVAGFHSNMLWLPEHNVGAVILTNGDLGNYVRSSFKRKLLEVLFDGKPEADAAVAAAAKNNDKQTEADLKEVSVPAAADEVAKLSARYSNDALGDIAVTKKGAVVTFDFTEWKSEMGTRKNVDGSISFETVSPGFSGIAFHPGTANNKRTLVLRDAQHEYVFTEVQQVAPPTP